MAWYLHLLSTQLLFLLQVVCTLFLVVPARRNLRGGVLSAARVCRTVPRGEQQAAHAHSLPPAVDSAISSFRVKAYVR